METDTITILKYGTQVRCDHVDMYGYNGRELHPSKNDVGFIGIVVGNNVTISDADGVPIESHDNVLGGTEYQESLEDDDSPLYEVCYIVQDASGRRLELMDHEIEVL